MTCHIARRAGQFERRLRRHRREVQRALEGTDAELLSLERPYREESVDDAATETTRRLLAHLEERDRHVLAEIDAAEDRLSRGTFGICGACGRSIPLPRLRALPLARHCIASEETVERTA